MRRLAGIVFALIAVVVLASGGLAWYTYARIASDLPSVSGLLGYEPPVMSRVYADDGHLIAELATERRIFVPYSGIPGTVKQAFVSAEDRTFWINPGVDPLAILRAAVADWEHRGEGRRPIGASTITQQVARNMLLDSTELSLARKIKEAILAMRIQQSLSKERILEIYLNQIYLGLGTYGVAAAAQTYFGKPLDQLTLAEAAFLAALPKGPNNYNPFKFPEAAKARRDWVIDRVREDGAISEAQAIAAKAQPLLPVSTFQKPQPIPGREWFADEVRRQLVEKFGSDTALQGGLTVRTSFDPALQQAAEKAVRDGLIRYDRSHGTWHGPVTRLNSAPGLLAADWTSELAQVSRPAGMLPDWQLAVVLQAKGGEDQLGWLDQANGLPISAAVPRVGPMLATDDPWVRQLRVGDVVMAELQPVGQSKGPQHDRLLLRQIPQVEGALVCVDPKTGRVLAMVGGWSHDLSQFNRATQASRQPGSSFKPMVYLTAMEQNISPSQQFLDAPFVLALGTEGQWRPSDYEQDWLGELPVRIALEKSRNLVTVRIAAKVGMDKIAKNAIAFHVVDQMPHVLPAALGAVETTVLRQAGAMASLAMGGREVIPRLIDTVQDREGHIVWRAPGLVCVGCNDPRTPPQIDDQRPQIADPQSVFQVVAMMQGVVKYGTGYEAGKGLNRAIAGKTGTTQDSKDAWFVGFTPDLVAVVWVGFDNPASLGERETGGGVAAPIWRQFMAVALQDRPSLTFPQPDGVTMATWNSGYGPRIDAFKLGQEPGASSNMVAQDQAGGSTSDASSPANKPTGGIDLQLGGLY